MQQDTEKRNVNMAEHALGGVLALYRQLPALWQQQNQHVWEKHRSLRELAGKGVCIVGYCSAAAECAKRFAAMGTDVVCVDRSPMLHKDTPFNAIYGMEKLDQTLGYSDIVILTIPDAKDTHHMFNAERFATMKPGAVLVNISCGGLVDTPALVDALKAGQLGGAVLDWVEEEPLSAESPLWDIPNVLITPHNGMSDESDCLFLYPSGTDDSVVYSAL